MIPFCNKFNANNLCFYPIFCLNFEYCKTFAFVIKLSSDILQGSNIYLQIMRKYTHIRCPVNRIGGVMVSVLTSNAVDRGFEPRSGQTKHYAIGICCFSDKYAALRRKSKD